MSALPSKAPERGPVDPRLVALLPSNDSRRLAFERAVAERLAAERAAEAAEAARAAAQPQVEPRVALRAVVAKHNAATRALAANAEAQERTTGVARDARRAIEQATAALKQAKLDVAAAVTSGGRLKPGKMTTATARERLVAAEDRLAAAELAATNLETERPRLEQTVLLAELRRSDAVAAVIGADPAVRALLDRFAQAQREVHDLRCALSVFGGKGLPRFWDCVPSDLPAEPDLAVAWRTALAKLALDADAELPTI